MKENILLKELFTARELEVINLLIQGLNNPEISKELFISNHTTKAHIASIFRKLGVNNRVLAAVKIIEHQKMSIENSKY